MNDDSNNAAPDSELPDFEENDATVVGAPSSITPELYPQGLTARELAHALRGEMLDHFLLQEFIGGGGMGVVFKALDTTLDRIVAVKVVASRHIDSEDLQRRFLVEAQSTARLDHPNIARIHYIGRDRGLPYIVFEYIDGMNVRELVAQEGPLPVAEAVSYAYQIAHALAHAWNRQVVHRDIKPSNIIVSIDGQAKLVDMGLARLSHVDDEHELTATGITLGTFDYISPEQARDPRSADARSDIYSLGCTLFFMLTGQAPFAQGTALQKLLSHQGEEPPDVRAFRSDGPTSVSSLLARMLAKSPEDRQQSPAELVADLADILQELGAPLPHSLAPVPWTRPAPAAPRWRKHAAWAVPIAALLATGFVADRLSRDDVAAAPFPALRLAAPALPTPGRFEAQVSPALPAVSLQGGVGGPETIDAATVAERSVAPAKQPLSRDEQWRLGLSLWDFFSKWPAPAPSQGEPAISDSMTPALGSNGGFSSPTSLPQTIGQAPIQSTPAVTPDSTPQPPARYKAAHDSQ